MSRPGPTIATPVRGPRLGTRGRPVRRRGRLQIRPPPLRCRTFGGPPAAKALRKALLSFGEVPAMARKRNDSETETATKSAVAEQDPQQPPQDEATFEYPVRIED